MKKLVLLFIMINLISVNVIAQKNVEKLIKKASIKIENEKYGEVMNLCNQVIRLDSTEAYAYFYKGLYHYYETDNNDSALYYFEKAKMLDINDDYIDYHIGTAYYYLDNYLEAKKHLLTVYSLYPEDIDVVEYLADTYLELGSDSSTYYYDLMIELDPKYFYGYAVNGMIAYDEKEYERALKYLDQALKLNKKDEFIYYYRSLTKEELHDLEGALQDIKESIKLNPDDFEYYHLAGYYCLNMDNLEKAVNFTKKSLEINKNNPSAFYNLALIQYFLDDYNNALKNINEGILLDTNDPDYYKLRGDIKYFSNDINGACIDWTLAASKGSEKARKDFIDYCEGSFETSVTE